MNSGLDGCGGMADVFISYKAEDRGSVRPLVAALEADGLSVWWDARIAGGQRWRETIEEQLDAARCVIVIWSRRSVGPEGHFVRDEATRALRRGVYLPVRLEPVDPPLGFGEMQALSLTGWRGDRGDPRYQAVLAGCYEIAKRTPPVATPERRLRIDRRSALAGGGALAFTAAGAGGWVWWREHRVGDAGDKGIVVLPFANLSGDPAQAYFSEGLTEELRGALTGIEGLRVIGRVSSNMARDMNPRDIAAKLNANAYLVISRSAHLAFSSAT